MRGQRLVWPDLAKGLSIIGVVILHVSQAIPGGTETALARANSWIDPVRMPLFFLVSGLFSAKVLHMSFGELFRRRLWFFLVPYMVWVPVELYTKNLQWYWHFGTPMRSVGEVAQLVVLGHTMGWFLHALILFNILLWCARRLSPPAVIALSLSPLLVLPLHNDLHAVSKAVMFLPIFVAGAYIQPWVFAAARAIDLRGTDLRDANLRGIGSTGARGIGSTILRRWSAWPAVILSAALALGYLGTRIRPWAAQIPADFELPWPLPGARVIGTSEIYLLARTVEQILMLPMAVVAAFVLAQIPLVAKPLAALGRHTLVIYLGHPIALTVGFGYLYTLLGLDISPEGLWPWQATSLWMGYGLLVAAGGALALHGVLRVPGLRATVVPPQLAEPQRHDTEQHGLPWNKCATFMTPNSSKTA